MIMLPLVKVSNEIEFTCFKFIQYLFLVGLDGIHTTNLGFQQSALWDAGGKIGDVPSVTYSEDARTVVVILQCSTTGAEEFEVLGEDPINVYIFRLEHKCACWDGCSSV